MAARIQPLTVLTVTAVLSLAGLWWLLGVFGAMMLVGAIRPEANLLDRWVSVLSGTEQRTTLHPKRFAAGMGGAMLLGAALAGIAGAGVLALVLAALTFAAAALQASVQFCIGCWIYNTAVLPWMQKARGQAG